MSHLAADEAMRLHDIALNMQQQSSCRVSGCSPPYEPPQHLMPT